MKKKLTGCGIMGLPWYVLDGGFYTSKLRDVKKFLQKMLGSPELDYCGFSVRYFMMFCICVDLHNLSIHSFIL